MSPSRFLVCSTFTLPNLFIYSSRGSFKCAAKSKKILDVDTTYINNKMEATYSNYQIFKTLWHIGPFTALMVNKLSAVKAVQALKTKGHQFGNFVTIGGTVSCHNNKLQCHQWWQSCQIDDLLYSQWRGCQWHFKNGIDKNLPSIIWALKHKHYLKSSVCINHITHLPNNFAWQTNIVFYFIKFFNEL